MDLRSPVYSWPIECGFARVTDVDGLDVLLPKESDGQVDMEIFSFLGKFKKNEG